jgi:hypothetical protein
MAIDAFEDVFGFWLVSGLYGWNPALAMAVRTRVGFYFLAHFFTSRLAGPSCGLCVGVLGSPLWY